MATGRDDFVIAFRSAFLKKKDKQKFSLFSLILLSVSKLLLMLKEKIFVEYSFLKKQIGLLL